MKKGTILNQRINEAIAGIGHTDILGIVDAGFPIPLGVERIDLTLRRGIPGFMDVLNTILEDFYAESYVIAQEAFDHSPEMAANIRLSLNGCPELAIAHAEFKQRMTKAKAIIRTAEFIPYSNVILVSGGFPPIAS